MIKRNEIKIKTSNKRLFSEISSHNLIPNLGNINNSSGSGVTKENTLFTRNQSSSVLQVTTTGQREDETDGKDAKKFGRIGSFNSYISSMPVMNVKNTIPLNPTNGYLTKIYSSTNNLNHKEMSKGSNMITMVVSNSNRSGALNNTLLPSVTSTASSSSLTNAGSLIGNNFAKRLQTIQTERILTTKAATASIK
jgi:hypothetical protein